MSKAKVSKRPNKAAEIARLKELYIEYYSDVPVQKYAAMAIGRDEDTIVLWRKADPEFSGRVEMARAFWVRKKATRVKAEFALERLEKEVWSERKELTGKGGGPMEIAPTQIMDVGSPNEELPDGPEPEATADR